jgi:16S rRNA (uracil1498-N3)-methyltransferase
MRANAIEAAQQCGILAVPEIAEPVEIKALLARASPDRLIVFCDEEAEVADPVAALGEVRVKPSALVPLDKAQPRPLAVLIGPEGGFSETERAMLLKLPNVLRLALGPRVLRADTAAIAALTLVQAVIGDWTDGASG